MLTQTGVNIHDYETDKKETNWFRLKKYRFSQTTAKANLYIDQDQKYPRIYYSWKIGASGRIQTNLLVVKYSQQFTYFICIS